MGSTPQLIDVEAGVKPAGGSITTLHQTLIIIGLISFFGGGGGEKSLEERVSEAVDDDTRSGAAVELAKRIDATWKSDVERVVGWHGEFYALIAKPETTEADMRLKVDEVIESIAEYEREQINQGFELRDALLEEEWREVFED